MTDAERRRQDIQGAYDCAVSVTAHLRAALDAAIAAVEVEVAAAIAGLEVSDAE